jgi:hypothetical protein
VDVDYPLGLELPGKDQGMNNVSSLPTHLCADRVSAALAAQCRLLKLHAPMLARMGNVLPAPRIKRIRLRES